MVQLANSYQASVTAWTPPAKWCSRKKWMPPKACWPSSHRSLYTFLAVRWPFPDHSRAFLTTAKNQTQVHEALIACALERYRLAHNAYPETLDALVPQFLAQIPPDLIGGQPLHYRRADDGKFLLYSVGWNETDDGGKPGSDDDWVWDDTTR